MATRRDKPTVIGKEVKNQRAKVVVTYDDDHVVEFNPNRPRWLLDMEQRFGVQSPETHEQVFWLAHHVCGDGVEFDDWVDMIADVDMVDLERQRAQQTAKGKADVSGERLSSTG
jgi:hypothetical protein